MRSVNIAELKNRLSVYLTFARNGEEVVVRDRNLPIAKLIPFSAKDSSDDELLLIAAGKMRPQQSELDLVAFWKTPTGKVPADAAIKALLKDREEGL